VRELANKIRHDHVHVLRVALVNIEGGGSASKRMQLPFWRNDPTWTKMVSGLAGGGLRTHFNFACGDWESCGEDLPAKVFRIAANVKPSRSVRSS